jgi:hypothetical protein
MSKYLVECDIVVRGRITILVEAANGDAAEQIVWDNSRWVNLLDWVDGSDFMNINDAKLDNIIDVSLKEE